MKRKWSPEDRGFFETVGQMVFMNPFDEAREKLLGGMFLAQAKHAADRVSQLRAVQRVYVEFIETF